MTGGPYALDVAHSGQSISSGESPSRRLDAPVCCLPTADRPKGYSDNPTASRASGRLLYSSIRVITPSRTVAIENTCSVISIPLSLAFSVRGSDEGFRRRYFDLQPLGGSKGCPLTLP